jgi:methyl-accepting chemotaxis protein
MSVRAALARLRRASTIPVRFADNLTIRTKLVTGFGLVIALASLVAWAGLGAVGRVESALADLYDDGLQPIRQLSGAVQAVAAFDRHVHSHVMAADAATMNMLVEQVAKEEQSLTTQLDAFKKTEQGKKQQERLTQIDQAWQAFRPMATQVLELSGQMKKKEAAELLNGPYGQVFGFIDSGLTELARASEDIAAAARAAGRGTAATARRRVLSAAAVAVFLGLALAIFTASGITRGLKVVMASSRQVAEVDLPAFTASLGGLSRGELSASFALTARPAGLHRRDEIGQLSAAFDRMMSRLAESQQAFAGTTQTLTGMADEMRALAAAAVEGRLATRGRAERFEGGYREIVAGVNHTLDAVVGPLNVAAEYVDRISKGDIPPRITDQYAGDFNEIKNNLNTCLDALTALAGSLQATIEAQKTGDVQARCDTGSLQGAYARLGEGINQALDAIALPVIDAIGVMSDYARGDLRRQVPPLPGKQIALTDGMNAIRTAVMALVEDSAALSASAVEGRLGARADAGRHQGEYRRVIEGVNDTLDSLVGFLDGMPAPAMLIDTEFRIRYMNRTGASLGGKTQQELVGTYCYDFFKTGDCHTTRCACAAAMRSGTLERSETQAHPGAATLDIDYSGIPVKDRSGRVIGAFEVVSDQTALKVASRRAQKVAAFTDEEVRKLVDVIGRLSAGDLGFTLGVAPGDADTYEVKARFEAIASAVSQCQAAVRALVGDTGTLAQAAVEGRLATRADASTHRGDFQKVVQGVNQTLDAVITWRPGTWTESARGTSRRGSPTSTTATSTS